MIFNLDRLIVSSMRKEERMSREFFTALPRIILAILISLVIARPLELKIFEKEIEPELVVMEQQVYTSQENLVRARFEPLLAQQRQDIQKLKKEVNDKAFQRNELMHIAQQEADGTGGSKIRNLGPIYKAKKADADNAGQELNELSKLNNQKISVLEKQVMQGEKNLNAALQALARSPVDGPAARMEALNHLTAKSSAIRWAHLFILLLFLMIESTPVLVKLISRKGPYDSLLRITEHQFVCKEVEEVATASTEVRKRTANLSGTEQTYVTQKLDAELL
jgi:hypothetical protein